MDILNTPWLIKMLEKSSQTPHGRLLNLFDVLEDWLDAPHINVQISAQLLAKSKSKILQDFLTIEAEKAGAAIPEMLANQLYFMAVAAVQEKLKANNHKSLSHARYAAKALIAAQTKKDFHISKSLTYSIAASFLGVIIISGSWLLLRESIKPTTLAQTSLPASVVAAPLASPEQTAALMAELERMRHGNCQLIEAIQLPDNLKGIYLNMIVNGQVSTDPHEQKIAMELLKKTRCNYTPMLMANSTG